MPSVTDDCADEHTESVRPDVDGPSPAFLWAKLSKGHSADEQESISPLTLSRSKDLDDFNLDPRGHIGDQDSSSSKIAFNGLERIRSDSVNSDPRAARNTRSSKTASAEPYVGKPQYSIVDDPAQGYAISAVLDEVAAWLHAEKAKKMLREMNRKAAKHDELLPRSSSIMTGKCPSNASDDESPDLEKLEAILDKGLVASRPLRGPNKRRSTRRRRMRHDSSPLQDSQGSSAYKSSDTENYEDDPVVPDCDIVLDNSQIVLDASSFDNPLATFKREICRLAQTLKIRGWKCLPLSLSNEIVVERLSGALTNAVYVVSAPKQGPDSLKNEHAARPTTAKRKPLPKLILRVYGPRVEHLIDRKTELQVLRRLARKNIGPRLLGTFANGRFEEFFYAKPLEPRDLRIPDTYQKIAKRMRELHDGIEVLKEERLGGPFVWRNWDKWVDRAERLAPKADVEIERLTAAQSSNVRHFVCGTPWKFFRQTVEKYRQQLVAEYGSISTISEQLVFAHNDTQYGNILRLEPPGESPLLLPANQHKQLVVIDFEYANANVRGLEFANHFTEWCYDYHDPLDPCKCNTTRYPTADEQYRFIRAYVLHRRNYKHGPSLARGYAAPLLSRSVSSLDLESNHENSMSSAEDDMEFGETSKPGSDADVDREIQRLMHETRLWRVANSAQWVLWGILQANLPDGLSNDGISNDMEVKKGDATIPSTHSEKQSVSQVETNQDDRQDQTYPENFEPGGFDYLGYARGRAMFLWGDCIQLGLVTEEELGPDLMKEVKVVAY